MGLKMANNFAQEKKMSMHHKAWQGSRNQGGCGDRPPHILAYIVNPISIREGAYYVHHIPTHPPPSPDFQTFSTALQGKLIYIKARHCSK